MKRCPDGRYKVAGNANWILDEDVVEVHYDANEGFACETSGGLVVVLDLHLTDALKQEGVARELVRHIQTLRKEANYRLDDRISVGITTDDATIRVILADFGGYVQAEVLADSLITDGSNGTWDVEKALQVEGASFSVGVKKSG